MLNRKKCISFSIVSHNQASMVSLLLEDFRSLQDEIKDIELEILVTQNTTQETLSIPCSNNLNLKIIKNTKKLGFGVNHNNAFKSANGEFFVVINPDIRFDKYIHKIREFLSSLESLEKNIAVISPIEIDSNGKKRENYRKFITISDLLRRRFLPKFESRIQISKSQKIVYVDWISGMFMCFRAKNYSELNGFDARYYMYCEDMDICRRINQKGLKVAIWNDSCIQHEGQFASRKSAKYFLMHLVSMAKYYIKYR